MPGEEARGGGFARASGHHMLRRGRQDRRSRTRWCGRSRAGIARFLVPPRFLTTRKKSAPAANPLLPENQVLEASDELCATKRVFRMAVDFDRADVRGLIAPRFHGRMNPFRPGAIASFLVTWCQR